MIVHTLGTAMISIDVGMTDVQIEKQLAAKCSKFANVTQVRLLPRTDVTYRFAFIEVTTKAETLELAAAVGGTSFGSTTVVIRLEDPSQMTAPLPVAHVAGGGTAT